MKFSGSGNTALHELEKYMKKSKNKTRSINHKIQTEPKSETGKKIQQSFELETIRKFPLEEGITYSPDYILTNMRDGKKIIINVDEDIIDVNVSKYRQFMKAFGNAYYVIMLVNDCQLRTWNEKDMNRGMLFDEIWTVENVNDMINSLKNPHNTKPNFVLAVCQICNKSVRDIKKIKTIFPYRIESNGSIIIQPYCRKCKRETRPQIIRVQESSVRCLGCATSFKTEIASKLYCDSCENDIIL